jgi:hypothetical protein
MKFIGNSSSVINWPELVDALKTQQGRFRGSDQEDDIHHNPKVAALRKLWQRAGYEGNKAVGWHDYECPSDIVNTFAEYVNVVPIGAWITSVRPGYVVPWHYDITDDEAEILEKGIVKRFTCHISKPSFGQVFILESEVCYNREQGDVFEWDDWQQWHGGMNMGLEPKFLFNFLGYAK